MISIQSRGIKRVLVIGEAGFIAIPEASIESNVLGALQLLQAFTDTALAKARFAQAALVRFWFGLSKRMSIVALAVA